MFYFFLIITFIISIIIIIIIAVIIVIDLCGLGVSMLASVSGFNFANFHDSVVSQFPKRIEQKENQTKYRIACVAGAWK